MGIELLPDQIPWYVAGPAMGLIVVALFAIANQRLGVSSTYYNVALLFRDRSRAEMWRVWFFVGLFGGAMLATWLRGDLVWNLGYGVLGRALPLGLLVPILLLGGVLMGYGARWAGGCTSGHGLTGTSTRSPGSWAATITFFGTAVVVTLVLHLISGGLL